MKKILFLALSVALLFSLAISTSYAGGDKGKEELSPRLQGKEKAANQPNVLQKRGKKAGQPRKKPTKKERRAAEKKRLRGESDEGTSATEDQMVETPVQKGPRSATGLTPMMGGIAFSPVAVGTPNEEQHDANIENLSNLLTGNPHYFQEILRRQFAQHRAFLDPFLRNELGNDPAAIIDEQVYFEHLIKDPAHEITKLNKVRNEYSQNETRVKSILEAFAGLEAVHKEKVMGPLIRGPKEIEFYADGVPIDVKTTRFNLWLRTYSQLPDGPNGEAPAVTEQVQDHVNKLAKAIVKQLRVIHISASGRESRVKVLLDTSFLTRNKAAILDRAILEALDVLFPNSYHERLAFMSKNIISVNIAEQLQFVFHPEINVSESDAKRALAF